MSRVTYSDWEYSQSEGQVEWVDEWGQGCLVNQVFSNWKRGRLKSSLQERVGQIGLVYDAWNISIGNIPNGKGKWNGLMSGGKVVWLIKFFQKCSTSICEGAKERLDANRDFGVARVL